VADLCKDAHVAFALRAGLRVAWLAGGDAQFLATLDTAGQWEARKRLLRSATPAALADLA
jgi:hypothetical protein